MAELYLADEAATLACGTRMVPLLARGGLVCLEGELGAGKTTLCRGVLRALGHRGRVKSPTFTLVEPYDAGGLHIFHIDLYRVADAAELEYIGLDDCFSKDSLTLVEWPENGAGWLPDHDLWLRIERSAQARTLSWCEDSEWGKELERLLSVE